MSIKEYFGFEDNETRKQLKKMFRELSGREPFYTHKGSPITVIGVKTSFFEKRFRPMHLVDGDSFTVNLEDDYGNKSPLDINYNDLIIQK